MSAFEINLDIPVLVPFRSDGAEREENWNLIRKEVWGSTPIFEGTDDDGPFNRSLAINRAADAAGDWDVAIIADADSITDPEKIAQAVAEARATGKLVFPFTRWVNVYQEERTAFLKTGILPERPERRINPISNSALFVVPRQVWDKVNGFDEHFTGWGFEDMAFIYAVRLLTGNPIRYEGDVFHLDHARDAHIAGRPYYKANKDRFKTYKYTSLPVFMEELVAENRATL